MRLGKFNTRITTGHLFLVTVTLLALVLRFFKLGEWSFWIEEHHTIRTLNEIGSFEDVFNLIRPLFFIISKPVVVFLGIDEWTSRLVPALIGIVTVPLLYLAVKKLLGSRVAIISAVLLAISPWHIYWSQNARFYTLFLLLYNICLLAFYWGVETNKFRYIIVSVVSLALAGATHGLAILCVPLFLFYFLLLKILPLEKPIGLKIRNIAPFVLLPFVGYFFYEIFRLMLSKSPLFWVLYTKFFDEATAFIGYGDPKTMVTSVVYYVGTPLAFLAVLAGFVLLRERNRAGLFLSVGAFGPLLMLMVLTPFASTVNRYAFMTLPCWIILGAVTIDKLLAHAKVHKVIVAIATVTVLLLLVRDPVVRDVAHYFANDVYIQLVLTLAIVAGFLAIVLTFYFNSSSNRYILVAAEVTLLIVLVHPLLTDYLYYFHQGGHRDNWKLVSATIKREKLNDDAVVSSITPLAEYYIGEEVSHISEVDLNSVLQNGQRIWVVEDYGVDQAMNNTFKEWANANCSIVNAWDQYTAGRNWKMRVHLCSQDRLTHHAAE